MYYQLNIEQKKDAVLQRSRSLLLLGPSQTGKAILLKRLNAVDAVKVARFVRQLATLPIADKTAAIWLSQDTEPRSIGEVQCLHWQQAIDRIFAG